MTDLISRQDAYNTLTEYYHHRTETQHEALKEALGRVPEAQSVPCEFCGTHGIEDGDTLYISADWDGGIGFDYIRDVHYCPRCGRRLLNG